MNRLIKISIIALLILQFGTNVVMMLLPLNNYYASVAVSCILYSVVILYYFNELYKSNISYPKVIVIAFLIPLVLYNFGFLYNYFFYNFTETGKEQLARILPPAGYQPNSGPGLGGTLEPFSFRSPLDYSFFDSLTQSKIYRIITHYHAEQYTLIFVQIISYPLVLLAFFSRYQIFKKLDLKPLMAIISPFNYFLLIDKFELPKSWKIYLFLPIVNVVIVYRINSQVAKLFHLPSSNAWGLLFLPFIYYPKIAFGKDNSYIENTTSKSPISIEIS